MSMQPVSISLHDESAGYAISPDRVPLSVLRGFAKDADEFLKGDSAEVDTSSLDVAVEKGSIAIRTAPMAAPGLFADLRRLSHSELLDGLDAKRRQVVERWQKLAQGSRRLVVTIASPVLRQPVTISPASDYRADDADQWVGVERYLSGEVVELGGTHSVNAHIRLPDGRRMVVESTREVFRSDKVNRLYKTAMVRISAEYNVVTREYRNARLIAFEEHQNEIDEAQLRKLTQRGAKAWKDVTSPAEWVESLRGGED